MEAVQEGLSFEDLSIGMSAHSKRIITVNDINNFADISGDYNPIHVDEEWALNTRFGGIIAHGMLTASLVSSIIGTRMPGPGNVYISQLLEFRAPVRPNDEIFTEVTVTELILERNRVKLATRCLCDEVEVLRGEALLYVRSRGMPL